jgi:hypothetical protein
MVAPAEEKNLPAEINPGTIDEATGKLEEGSRDASQNNFQGRYAIRHEWTGAIACASPVRHRWGGPPSGESYAGPQPGKDLARAPRGAVKLAQLVAQDVPEVDIKAAGGTTAPAGAPEARSGGKAPSGAPAAHGKGCGCQSSTGTCGGGLLLVAVLFILRRKR